jgi:glycosyltransferase involved in cell wall biosynthesis
MRTPEGLSQHLDLWVVSSHPPPIHGVSVFTQLLLEHFTRFGIDYRFFRVGSNDKLRYLGAWSLSSSLRDTPALCRLAIAAIRRRLGAKPRPVVYFTPSAVGFGIARDAVVVALARVAGARIVAHAHGFGWINEQNIPRVFSHFRKHVISRCHTLICLGPTHAELMRDAYGASCVSINNGTPSVGNCTSRPSLSRDACIELLFLSNLLRSKGLWAAATAARLLRDAGFVVRLRCAGAWACPDDESAFRSEFSEDLQSGTIVLTGSANESQKADLLRTSHFLLLPTEYPLEGQPLVLLEAMSTGLVPITSDHAGIPDLLNFPEAKELASRDNLDPRRIRDLVVRTIESPGTYARLSRLSEDHFNRHLSFDRCAGEILTVLRLTGSQSNGNDDRATKSL